MADETRRRPADAGGDVDSSVHRPTSSAGGPAGTDRNPADAPAIELDRERDPELRLARLHLRSGVFALARAGLETAAGNGSLDELATLDLAEIRWRTGDLAGAGVAAEAYLAADRDDVLARVIAADAAAADGRLEEAGRHGAAALEMAGSSLDTVFAGQLPVWEGWPAELGDARRGHATPRGSSATYAATQVDAVRTELAGLAPSRSRAYRAATTDRLDASERDVARSVPMGGGGAMPVAGGAPAPEPPGPPVGEGVGLAATPPAAAPLAAAPPDTAGPNPAPPRVSAVRDGRDAGGSAGPDLLALAVALRLDPGSASEIVTLLTDTPGIEATLLRGDALRVLGRDEEARAAYETASGLVGEQREATARPATPQPGRRGTAGRAAHPAASENVQLGIGLPDVPPGGQPDGGPGTAGRAPRDGAPAERDYSPASPNPGPANDDKEDE